MSSLLLGLTIRDFRKIEATTLILTILAIWYLHRNQISEESRLPPQKSARIDLLKGNEA